MGTLTEEFLYTVNPPTMRMRKKVKVFKIYPNGMYDITFVEKSKTGRLIISKDLAQSSKENPLCVSPDGKESGLGTVNASTQQPAYIWYEGEKFAYPLAMRETLPRNQDEDMLHDNAFEEGRLFERKNLQGKDVSADRIAKLIALNVLVSVGIAIALWQLLGKL